MKKSNNINNEDEECRRKKKKKEAGKRVPWWPDGPESREAEEGVNFFIFKENSRGKHSIFGTNALKIN